MVDGKPACWGRLRASVRECLDTLDGSEEELRLMTEEDGEVVETSLLMVVTMLEIALDKCADVARENGLA